MKNKINIKWLIVIFLGILSGLFFYYNPIQINIEDWITFYIGNPK